MGSILLILLMFLLRESSFDFIGLAEDVLRIPEHYKTIQAAVDLAPSGATILIGPGKWSENIVLKKNLTLRGSGPKSVIQGDKYSPTLKIVSEAQTVSVRVENLNINGGNVGISVEGPSAEVSISDCWVSKSESAGLRACGASVVYIDSCRFNNTVSGLYICDAAKATITNTEIFQNRMGVRVYDVGRAKVYDCFIFENDDGILIGDFAYLAMDRCTVFDQFGYGVCIGGSAKATISNNVIINSGLFGIRSDSSLGNVIGEQNRMCNNGVDLGGNVYGVLRIPLREPTEKEIIYPDPRFRSLQEAVDALSPGGILRIRPGTYVEQATIAKVLYIRGEPGATLLAPTAHNRPDNEHYPLLSLVGGAEVDIESLECCSQSARLGGPLLMVGGDARVVMRKCRIHGGTEYDVSMYGVLIMGTSEVEFKGCFISKTSAGSEIRQFAQLRIVNCTFVENFCGVFLKDFSRAEIISSFFIGNRYAIYSVSEKEAVGQGNVLVDNGVDLAGNVSGLLRLPMREPTEQEISFPDPRYQTLQEAIDALVPGGKLIMAAGEYPAGVTIGKPVIFEARDENCVVLIPKVGSPVVLSLVGGAEAVMKCMDISSGQESRRIAGGLLLGGRSKAILYHCKIMQVWTGAELSGYSEASFINCIFSDNDWAIVVKGYALCIIEDSTISESYFDGVVVEEGGQVAILNSIINLNKGNGIELWETAKLEIRETQILQNGRYGIWVNIAGCPHFKSDRGFTGSVTGSANNITGADDPKGNKMGALCPPYPGHPWPPNFLR